MRRLALLLQNFGDDARLRRGEFYRGFVGFNLDEVFSGGGMCTFAFAPVADEDFSDRFAQ